MHARRVSFFLGFVFCGLPTAAQQPQVAKSLMPASSYPASRPERMQRLALTPDKKPASNFTVEVMQIQSEFSRTVPAPLPRGRFADVSPIAPLRFTTQRSSFLTESRIPIMALWRGRLRFSGVQQRFHAANLYSTLTPAFFAEATLAPGAESIVGRPRVNYGVGVQLRFGR